MFIMIESWIFSMLSHFLVRSRLIRRGWVESFVNRWNALRISPNWLHVWNNLMLCCVCSSSLIPVVEQNKKSHRLSFFVLRSDTCGASLAVFYVSIVDERFGKAWKIWFLRSSQVIFPFFTSGIANLNWKLWRPVEPIKQGTQWLICSDCMTPNIV